MTRLEERVRDALIAQADQRPVDVDALWKATRVRLRPRRRGRVVALAAAAVVVVAVGAVVLLGDGGTEQRPIERPTQAPTSPQPSPPEVTQPRTPVLRDDGSYLTSVVFVGTSVSIAQWEVCGDPDSFGICSTVLARTEDGWSSLRVTRPPVRYGVPMSILSDGSVAVDREAGIDILGPDGHSRHADVTKRPTPAGSDDAIFHSFHGSGIWAYDKRLNRAFPIPSSPHIDEGTYATRAQDGRIWLTGDSRPGVSVAWSSDGGATWSEHVVTRHGHPAGLAVGADGQLAVFAWTEKPGEDAHFRNFISYDSGASWQPFDLPVGPAWTLYDVSNIATLSDGTIFAVDQKDLALWMSTGDWQEWVRVPQAGQIGSIQSNDELLWAHAGGNQVVVSDDGGRTWRTVIPG